MKHALLIIFLLAGLVSFAQDEQLYQLEYNPTLYYKPNPISHHFSRQIYDGNYVQVLDTLQLPFLDDFSGNTVSDVSYPEGLLSIGFMAGACFDTSSIPVRFSTDIAWRYTFDVVNQEVDSVALPPVYVVFFDDTSNCNLVTEIRKLWPEYYFHTSYNTTTGIPIDTVRVFDLILEVNELDSINVALPDIGKLYADNHVYINNTYPIDPLSIGVATFDGLNKRGLPHATGTSAQHGAADSLTSKPINLAGLSEIDAVYMSFWWEPQGLGDYPNPDDSLVLEFRRADDTWATVWSTGGFNSSVQFPAFTFENILIITPYLHDAFQFRFRNYASIYGNNDHWHIDYIYIDAARTIDDDNIRDVAYRNIPTRMLRNYVEMPWNQFADYQQQELATEFRVTFRNNSSGTELVDYQYHLKDILNNNILFTSTPPLTTNLPTETDRTEIYNTGDFAPITLADADSNVVALEAFLNAAGDLIRTNDTVQRVHHFYNYFAYDDGSAERAYGLQGLGLKKLAYRFVLNEPDTLRAIQIHFTQIDFDASDELFSIYVWKKLDLQNQGAVEDTLAILDFKKPFYSNTLNGFVNYILEEPLLVSDTFYVGWQQAGERNLQVGYDLNNSAKTSTYYFTNSSWKQTLFDGALMIRPVLGKDVPMIGASIKENTIEAGRDIILYPNPATGMINIKSLDGIIGEIEVYDITGRLQHRSRPENSVAQINISGLKPGMHFVRIWDYNHTQPVSKRFVKVQ